MLPHLEITFIKSGVLKAHIQMGMSGWLHCPWGTAQGQGRSRRWLCGIKTLPPGISSPLHTLLKYRDHNAPLGSQGTELLVSGKLVAEAPAFLSLWGHLQKVRQGHCVQPALWQWLWARAVVVGHVISSLQFIELLVSGFFSFCLPSLFLVLFITHSASACRWCLRHWDRNHRGETWFMHYKPCREKQLHPGKQLLHQSGQAWRPWKPTQILQKEKWILLVWRSWLQRLSGTDLLSRCSQRQWLHPCIAVTKATGVGFPAWCGRRASPGSLGVLRLQTQACCLYQTAVLCATWRLVPQIL